MRKELIEAQIVLGRDDVKRELKDSIRRNAWKRIFLVAGNSFFKLPIGRDFAEIEEEMGITVEKFSGFSVNPKLEEAIEGSRAFKAFSGDVIIAVGGGSAMDTGKCIKLFSAVPEETLFQVPWQDNGVAFVAIPTTAGSGSESTPFAVLYRDGEKLSIEDESIYPLIRVEDARSLAFLPLYQKKVCLMDALSHAMEAIWCKNSVGDSMYYGKEAIETILDFYQAYFDNQSDALQKIAYAANQAGKAIAITKTTGGHALSYKLGTLFGLPHGLATSLVNKELYPLLTRNKEKMEDLESLQFLAHCFGGNKPEEGVERYLEFLEEMELIPKERRFYLERMDLQDSSPEKEQDFWKGTLETLTKSVNVERLQNHPMPLSEEEISGVYRSILMIEE